MSDVDYDSYDQGGERDDAPSNGAVTKYEGTRLPYNKAIQAKYEVDVGAWRVLTEAIFPAARSAEAIGMALAYCRHRNLDIFKRPVHIVPMWSTVQKKWVETVWPAISELRTTAFRTKQYAGNDEVEWGPLKEKTFKGVREKWEYDPAKKKRVPRGEEEVEYTVAFHEWGRMTLYRKVEGLSALAKFVGPKVIWQEICAKEKSGVPNDRWRSNPIGQHEKTIEAAALRRAFPEEIGSDMAAEEMDGQILLPSMDAAPSQVEAINPNAGIEANATKALNAPNPNSSMQTVHTTAVKEKEAAPAQALPAKQQAQPASPKKQAAPKQPEIDVGAELMELENKLAGLGAEEDVREVYDSSDIESRLQGTEKGVEMARDIGQRHINRARKLAKEKAAADHAARMAAERKAAQAEPNDDPAADDQAGEDDDLPADDDEPAAETVDDPIAAYVAKVQKHVDGLTSRDAVVAYWMSEKENRKPLPPEVSRSLYDYVNARKQAIDKAAK